MDDGFRRRQEKLYNIYLEHYKSMAEKDPKYEKTIKKLAEVKEEYLKGGIPMIKLLKGRND